MTTIIDPSDRKDPHNLPPERWGVEQALTWLERGECLLNSGLVYSYLGILLGKDPTVSIFMGKHDLQRLMAVQAVKQEAAPPPGPYDVAARKGAEKPIYDWDDGMNFCEIWNLKDAAIITILRMPKTVGAAKQIGCV